MALHLFRKVGISALFAAGVLAVGFGVPLVWLLIAAEIQGASGLTRMTTETALAVFPGIAVTYGAVLSAVNLAVARYRKDEPPLPPSRTRYPWMRSMRDEPAKPNPPTTIEMVFITAASAVTIAFMVWFFLWAGNPLPN